MPAGNMVAPIKAINLYLEKTLMHKRKLVPL